MAELADAQDLGDVTSVKDLPFHSSPAPPKLNITKKEQKKLEEKLAEAVASTGQDEQNKQDTASKETNTQS